MKVLDRLWQISTEGLVWQNQKRGYFGHLYEISSERWKSLDFAVLDRFDWIWFSIVIRFLHEVHDQTIICLIIRHFHCLWACFTLLWTTFQAIQVEADCFLNVDKNYRQCQFRKVKRESFRLDQEHMNLWLLVGKLPENKLLLK